MKRNTSIAVNIWKKEFGEVPKDSLGRSYDIHHIDGNKDNNNINNLKAVSLEEHWKIHFDRGEFAAANLIADRFNKKYYFGWKHSEEVRKKISEVKKGKKSNRFWITNGFINTNIKIGDLIPNGWSKGKTTSEATKEKIRAFNLGKKQSEETKNKRAKKLTGKKRSEATKIKQRESWTEERRKKTAEWMSENRSGENNPNFGRIPWNKK
jgi:hypothetical protein